MKDKDMVVKIMKGDILKRRVGNCYVFFVLEAPLIAV